MPITIQIFIAIVLMVIVGKRAIKTSVMQIHASMMGKFLPSNSELVKALIIASVQWKMGPIIATVKLVMVVTNVSLRHAQHVLHGISLVQAEPIIQHMTSVIHIATMLARVQPRTSLDCRVMSVIVYKLGTRQSIC